MDRKELRILIEGKAAERGVDPDLVEAVIMTESSGRYLSARFEKGFYKTYVEKLPVKESWKMFYATSWGLMQIMGLVAYEMGFPNNPVELMDPETNLRYGIQFLKRKIDKYGIPAGIAAYNSGTPRKTASGEFTNQVYLDRVNRFLKEIKEEKNGSRS
jgi:soluble lytic murein transglycosylase-like protein